MGLGVINLDLGSAVEKLVDAATRWIPDANEKIRVQGEIRTQIHDELLAQLDVNKEEAKHTSVFVAGWRPFIGWVCGIALSWTFIVAPVIQYSYPSTTFPDLDISQLVAMVTCMLGMAGIRSFDKMNGTA